MKLLRRLYQKKVPSKGLSVFRILFSIVLFFEVFRIFNFRQLYFDTIPFAEVSTINFTYPLLAWMLVLIFLVFGYFTRIATILNYLLAVFVLTNVGAFEYHMDYAYIGMAFIMMFLPLAEHYSFDIYFRKKKPRELVTVLYYYIPITIGIGFVYLGSIPFKFTSQLWMNGLGVWLPSSVPQVTILNDQWLLNQEYFMKGMSYFTLLFELLFPFIFFIKKLRPWLFLCGIGLHIGILLEFPIPYFALGVMAIYVLLVPNYWWDCIEHRFGFSKKVQQPFNFLVSAEIVKKERVTFQFLKLLTVLLVILQVNVLAKFLFKEEVRTHFSGIESQPSKLFKSLKYVNQKLINVSTKTLGITPHGLFIDGHFRNFSTIYSLRHKGEYLPLYDEFGMPDSYLQGGSWANFNFRVNKPGTTISSKELQRGLARYASFWAHKNDISLENNSFEIIEKKIQLSFPFEWEEDLLLKNRMSPWEKVATLVWNKNTATFEVTLNNAKP